MLVWGELDRWPTIYHFFHYINTRSKYTPWAIQLKQIIVFTFYSSMALMLPLGTSTDPSNQLSNIISKISTGYMTLNFIGQNRICFITLAIALYSSGTLAYFYKNQVKLVNESSVSLVFNTIHVLIPINTLLTINNVQAVIKDAIQGDINVFNMIVLLLAFILSFSSLILSFIMTTKSLNITSDAAVYWDIKYRASLFIVFPVCQQLWNLKYIYPEYGLDITCAVQIVCNIYLLYLLKDFPLFYPKTNTRDTALTMLSIVKAIYHIIEKNLHPNSTYPLAITVTISILVATSGVNLMMKYFHLRLQKLLDRTNFNDFSDDSNNTSEIPYLPNRSLIPLLRYLTQIHHRDLGETLIRIADMSTDCKIQIECYRLLVLIGVTPTIVWEKIMEINPNETPFYYRQLLCDLQYSALKACPKDDLNRQISELDTLKQNARTSVIPVIRNLIEGNTNLAASYLSNFILKCEEYTTYVTMCLNNIPKSPRLITHYCDFLTKTKGDFVTAFYFNMMLSNTPGSLSTSSIRHAAEISYSTQIMSQTVLSRIKSRAMPFIIGLSLLLLVSLIVPIFSPFSWKVTLPFDLEEYYCIKAAPYYYTFNLENWYMQNYIQLFQPDYNSSGIIQRAYVLLGDFLGYAKLVWRGTDFYNYLTDPIKNIDLVAQPHIVINNFINEVTNMTHKHIPTVQHLLNNSDKFFLIADYLDGLMDMHSQFGSSKISRTLQIIIWSFVFYCAVEIILIIIISLIMLIAIPSEEDMYLRVFSEIDQTSLESFKLSLQPRKSSQVPVVADINVDEFLLDDEEVEASNSAEIYMECLDEDKARPVYEKPSRITTSYIFISSVIFFPCVVMISVSSVLVPLILYLESYSTANTDSSRLLIEISRMSIEFCRQSSEHLKNSLDNITYKFQPIEMGYYSFSDPFIKTQSEKFKDLYTDLNNNLEEVSKSPSKYAIKMIADSEIIVRDIFAYISELGSEDQILTRNLAYVSLVFCVLAVIIFSTFIQYVYENQNQRFTALKSLALLLPSRYISPVTMLLAEFRKKDSVTLARFNTSRNILEHTRDPIIVFDSDQKIFQANKQALALLSLSKYSQKIQNLKQVFPVEKQETFYQYIDALYLPNGARATRQVNLVAQLNDTEIPISGLMIPLNTQEYGVVVMLVIKERTEKILTRKNIDRANRRIRALLRRLVPPKIGSQLMRANANTTRFLEFISIVAVKINGLSELAKFEGFPIADFVETLMCRLDNKARKHPNIARLWTIDGLFMFVAGIVDPGAPKEEISKTAIQFARRGLKTISKHANSYTDKVTFCALVHAGGPAISGAIGGSGTLFDTWGGPIDNMIHYLTTLTGSGLFITQDEMDLLDKMSVNVKAVFHVDETDIYSVEI